MMSDDVSSGGTKFMHGQVGDEKFAITTWNEALENAKHLPEGFDQKPRYIQLEGTSGPENVVFGALLVKKGTEYREVSKGFLGIGAKTEPFEVIKDIGIKTRG